MDACFRTRPLQHVRNAQARRAVPWPAALDAILSPADVAAAHAEISTWPDYAPTPLRSLELLATSIGVEAVAYKDEASRFGLGSFKALGGAYAVACLLQRELTIRLGRNITLAEVRSGTLADEIAKITVCTATDGNHGRSVAWGAQMFGCPCVIYIHAEVSAGREVAMEAFGACVVRIDGNYDESVRAIERDANRSGWYVVSDTSYEGYVELPRTVAAGYTVLMEEIAAVESAPWTHVFVQGGVGGLASAVCGHLWQRFGAQRPRMVVVEPAFAACLFESARAGAIRAVDVTQESLMAGLSCGEVSPISWEILRACADDFLAIDEALVAPCMQMLAGAEASPEKIVAGESGVAGLAGLLAAVERSEVRAALDLQGNSRVLLIGSEGATDPDIYAALVGQRPEIVASA